MDPHEILRIDLINHFGSLAQFYPAAYTMVDEVRDADDDRLEEIALDEGFDLDQYGIDTFSMN